MLNDLRSAYLCASQAAIAVVLRPKLTVHAHDDVSRMFNCSMQHDAGLLLLQLRFVSFRLWTEQEARQVTRAERLP